MKDASTISDAGRLLQEIGEIDREARDGIKSIGLTLKGRYIEGKMIHDEREHVTAIVGKIMGREIELRVRALSRIGIEVDWFPGVSEYAEALRKLRMEPTGEAVEEDAPPRAKPGKK